MEHGRVFSTSDLLPPRFERRTHFLDRIPLSPFDYAFGQEGRGRLFNGLVAEPGRIGIDLSVRPDPDGPVLVAAGADLDRKNPSVHAPFLRLGYENAHPALGERPLYYRGLVQLGADKGSTRAAVVGFDRDSGVGGYASATVEGANEQAGTAPGLGVSSADVGARWLSPSRTFSIGANASPLAPHSARVWAMGTIGAGGSVVAGVQATTDAGRWQPGSAASAAPASLVDLDVAVSVARVPTYDVSIALEGTRGEVVGAYMHHLTTRRSVLNPLADANVVGIWNYVDLGVEVRQQLRSPFATTAALGAAWQLNKNLMVKARAGSEGAAATVALKAWWEPAMTVSLTGAYSASRGEVAIGFRIGVESGLRLPDYDKADEGRQGAAQNVPMLAQPQLSERTRRGVDSEPFARAHPFSRRDGSSTRLL